MKRILLIIKRFFCFAAEIPKNIKEFGFTASIWIWWVQVLPSQKGTRYIRFLTKYFDDYFKPITKQFIDGTFDRSLHIPENHRDVGKKPVWVCWLQGEENMPELVKVCYRQLKKNIPEDAELHLLTLDNIDEYITLPEYVLQKFREKKITMIHFTDIMRSSLLYAYGGMWIDSTVWTAGKITNDFFDRNFYAQRTVDESQYENEPSRAKWSGFLFGGKRENILFGYMRNTLWYYWKEHQQLIEYLILDYSILGAYNNLESCKNDIDSVPCNNEKMWLLTRIINEKFDSEHYKALTTDTNFFKLTYKMELNKKTINGEDTYFKHLCDIAEKSE